MKIIIFLIFSFVCIASQASEVTESSLRWTNLMNLIKQEEITINKIKYKSDQLLYRLFELKTEKIKLYKESENRRFLSDKLKRKNISRKETFKKTLNTYYEVNELGHKILKNFPHTKYRSSIYYTLALNSRDYAYDKQEEKYLKLAIKYASGTPDIEYFAKTALAEYFYNQKKYHQAIRLYKEVTKNTQDEWYTKNLYNYGWCLLKVKDFKRSTVLLEKAYLLSKSTQYIDFRDQALNSLVSFYVISDQVNMGKDFILKNEEDAFPYIFKLMKKVAEKGDSQKAQKLMNELDGLVKNNEQKVSLKIYQLSFYQRYKNYTQMLATSRDLAPLQISQEDRKVVIETLSHTVGLFQLTIKKDFSRYNNTYDQNKLDRIEQFFGALINLDSGNRAKYEYLFAETYFSLHEYQKALFQYQKAFHSYTKEISDLDIRQKSLKAMMACLERTDTNEKNYSEMLEFSYLNYSQIWPKDGLTNKIFPKFYYFYMASNRVNEARTVLQSYVQNFPQDLNKQQELFRNLMDYYIKYELGLEISNLISQMQSGYLKFKKQEITKAEKILAQILFTKYQKLNTQGRYTDAIEGYKGIYFHNRYPQKIKADAAFNIGIVLTNQLQSSEAIKWFDRSLKLLSDKDKLNKFDFLKKLATRMYLLQDFLNSAKLGKTILKKFCSITSKKNYHLLTQTIRSDLANDYVFKALHTYNTFSNCTQENMSVIQKEIVQHLYLFDHEKILLSFLDQKEIKEKFPTIGSHYLKKIFWKRYHREQSYLFILKQLKEYQCENCQILIKNIKELEQFKGNIVKFSTMPIQIPKDFMIDAFNQQLELRLLEFKKISNQGIELLKQQDSEISLIVLDNLTILNRAMAQELTALNPPGEKDFRQQFQVQMQLIASQFLNKSIEYSEKSIALMEDNQIFTQKFLNIQKGKQILDLADIRTPASDSAVTFDLTRN